MPTLPCPSGNLQHIFSSLPEVFGEPSEPVHSYKLIAAGTLSAHSVDTQHLTCATKQLLRVGYGQVEESTPFAPIARKEIGALAWHLVNELPMTKEQSAMVRDCLASFATLSKASCASEDACTCHMRVSYAVFKQLHHMQPLVCHVCCSSP